MRKSLIFAFCLFLAGACSIMNIIPEIQSQKEAVVITEQILEGDKNAAKGIGFQVSAQDGCLFWNTQYHIGESDGEDGSAAGGEGAGPTDGEGGSSAGGEEGGAADGESAGAAAADTCETEFTFSIRGNKTVGNNSHSADLKNRSLNLYGDYGAVMKLKEEGFGLGEDFLSGMQIPEGQQERQYILSADNWVYFFPRAVKAALESGGYEEGSGKYTGTVKLADYYPYYPLRLRLDQESYEEEDLKNAWGIGDGREDSERFYDVWSNEDGYDITEILRVPIPKEAVLEVSLETNLGVWVNASPENLPSLYGVQARGTEGYYFSFYASLDEVTESGSVINGGVGSPVPCGSEAGNGIYFIPMKKQFGRDGGIPVYPQLRKICDIPEESFVIDLMVLQGNGTSWENGASQESGILQEKGASQGDEISQGNGTSQENETLLLVIWENGWWRLDVLDLKTGEVSKGESLLYDPDCAYLEVRQVADRQLLMLMDGRFCLARVESGRFTEEISGQLDLDGNSWVRASDVASVYENMVLPTRVPVYEADYREGQLVFLAAEGSSGCSVRLSVFDRDGLQYLGSYSHSFDRLAQAEQIPQIYAHIDFVYEKETGNPGKNQEQAVLEEKGTDGRKEHAGN